MSRSEPGNPKCITGSSEEGEITDPDLAIFAEEFLKQGHDSRLMITSRRPLTLPIDARRFERRFPLEEGLPEEDAVSLLREFDPNGDIGLHDADPQFLVLAAKKTFGFPRALEAIAGILDRDPLLTLENLLGNERLLNERVIENLVGEAQVKLSEGERLVMQALAIFGRPVTIPAIRFLLEPYAIGVDIESVIRRLSRGRYIIIAQNTHEISVHPLDREYNYRQISDVSGLFNKQQLHSRTAQYYDQISIPEEQWHDIADIEPQLSQFAHLVKTSDFTHAAHLVSDLDYNYLSMWGHFRRSISKSVF